MCESDFECLFSRLVLNFRSSSSTKVASNTTANNRLSSSAVVIAKSPPGGIPRPRPTSSIPPALILRPSSSPAGLTSNSWVWKRGHSTNTARSKSCTRPTATVSHRHAAAQKSRLSVGGYSDFMRSPYLPSSQQFRLRARNRQSALCREAPSGYGTVTSGGGIPCTSWYVYSQHKCVAWMESCPELLGRIQFSMSLQSS